MRGDIVLLAESDRIPADAFLLSCTDLEADESLLTDESIPARKRAWMPPVVEFISTRLVEDEAPLAFAGAMIVRGNAMGAIFAAGTAREIGKIGKALDEIIHRAECASLQVRSPCSCASRPWDWAQCPRSRLYALMRGPWIGGFACWNHARDVPAGGEASARAHYLRAWRISKPQPAQSPSLAPGSLNASGQFRGHRFLMKSLRQNSRRTQRRVACRLDTCFEFHRTDSYIF